GRVFSLGGWSPQLQSGLLGAPDLLGYPCHTHHHASPTGLSPAAAGRSRPLRLTHVWMRDIPAWAPQPRPLERSRFGLFPVRSLLLGDSLFFSFTAGSYRFQFAAFALRQERRDMAPAGLPHSDIRGSQDAWSSPRLISACLGLL